MQSGERWWGIGQSITYFHVHKATEQCTTISCIAVLRMQNIATMEVTLRLVQPILFTQCSQRFVTQENRPTGDFSQPAAACLALEHPTVSEVMLCVSYAVTLCQLS